MVSRVLLGNNSIPLPSYFFISRIEPRLDSVPFAPYFFFKIRIIFYFFYMIVSIITILFRNSRRGNTYFTSRNNYFYLILLWSFEYTVFASKIALIWNLQNIFYTHTMFNKLKFSLIVSLAVYIYNYHLHLLNSNNSHIFSKLIFPYDVCLYFTFINFFNF